MAERAAFLERVRSQLGRASGAPADGPGRADPPAAPRTAAVARAPGDRAALVGRFRAAAEGVGAAVHHVATVGEASRVIRDLARARGVRRAVSWSPAALGPLAAAAAGLVEAGAEVADGAPLAPPAAARAGLRETLAAADLGLTGADLAVAETGSLLLASGPGKGRLVSLLPAVHVAVLSPDRVVARLAEVAAWLEAWSGTPGGPPGANVVLVTGPSRTADIELTLTRGVHGPKEVHVVLVDAG